MGIEEDLFSMLGNINFKGSRDTALFNKLLRGYQLNLLLKMREMINTTIRNMSRGSTVDDQFGDMNPYTILGVSIDATEAEVKKAYREKAWTSHPDRGGSTLDMTKVNAAWEAIKRIRGW